MATRKEELAAVRDVISRNIGDAKCGLFFTRNIAGDKMDTIFDGEFFTVDICYGYSYFEVFGCSDEEAAELKGYYTIMRTVWRDRRRKQGGE